jgi:hypothetical protein
MHKIIIQIWNTIDFALVRKKIHLPEQGGQFYNNVLFVNYDKRFFRSVVDMLVVLWSSPTSERFPEIHRKYDILSQHLIWCHFRTSQA